jgi:hypothetical protein
MARSQVKYITAVSKGDLVQVDIFHLNYSLKTLGIQFTNNAVFIDFKKAFDEFHGNRPLEIVQNDQVPN